MSFLDDVIVSSGRLDSVDVDVDVDVDGICACFVIVVAATLNAAELFVESLAV